MEYGEILFLEYVNKVTVVSSFSSSNGSDSAGARADHHVWKRVMVHRALRLLQYQFYCLYNTV